MMVQSMAIAGTWWSWTPLLHFAGQTLQFFTNSFHCLSLLVRVAAKIELSFPVGVGIANEVPAASDG